MPDFSHSWASLIDGDEVRPRMFIQASAPICWAVDSDGLVATFLVCDPDGNACMMSLLFQMPMGAAESAARKKRWPVRIEHGTIVGVSRKIDEVTGVSGERYCRFACDSVLNVPQEVVP